jgi:hypothetical protein
MIIEVKGHGELMHTNFMNNGKFIIAKPPNLLKVLYSNNEPALRIYSPIDQPSNIDRCRATY